jgi:hypothetical protein
MNPCANNKVFMLSLIFLIFSCSMIYCANGMHDWNGLRWPKTPQNTDENGNIIMKVANCGFDTNLTSIIKNWEFRKICKHTTDSEEYTEDGLSRFVGCCLEEYFWNLENKFFFYDRPNNAELWNIETCRDTCFGYKYFSLSTGGVVCGCINDISSMNVSNKCSDITNPSYPRIYEKLPRRDSLHVGEYLTNIGRDETYSKLVSENCQFELILQNDGALVLNDALGNIVKNIVPSMNMKTCFKEYPDMYLSGYASDGGILTFTNPLDAKSACLKDTTCNGITQNNPNDVWTLRKGEIPITYAGSKSFKKIPCNNTDSSERKYDYELLMEGTGELSLYRFEKNSSLNDNEAFVMELLWKSEITFENKNGELPVLILQNDRNLAIYNGFTRLWDSDTWLAEWHTAPSLCLPAQKPQYCEMVRNFGMVFQEVPCEEATERSAGMITTYTYSDADGRLGYAHLGIWYQTTPPTIAYASVNINTFYSTTDVGKIHVGCQEFGHALGLDHQSEDPWVDTDSCMDYFNGKNNEFPNLHDFEILIEKYPFINDTDIQTQTQTSGFMASRRRMTDMLRKNQKNNKNKNDNMKEFEQEKRRSERSGEKIGKNTYIKHLKDGLDVVTIYDDVENFLTVKPNIHKQILPRNSEKNNKNENEKL